MINKYRDKCLDPEEAEDTTEERYLEETMAKQAEGVTVTHTSGRRDHWDVEWYKISRIRRIFRVLFCRHQSAKSYIGSLMDDARNLKAEVISGDLTTYSENYKMVVRVWRCHHCRRYFTEHGLESEEYTKRLEKGLLG